MSIEGYPNATIEARDLRVESGLRQQPVSDIREQATIIIPVHDQGFFTRICLASLEREQGPAEAIVVDNGSSDDTPDLLARWVVGGPRRRFLRHEQNVGFARGCNSGAEVALGEYLVFLNNDTFVLDGWLRNLLAPFEDPSIKVAGSRLLYPSGHLQHGGVAFNEIGPFHVFMGLPGDLPVVMQQRDYQVVTGASLAVRASEFRRLHGFDAAYCNSFEDVDFCLRVREKEGRVIYVPDSVAYHFESMTEGRLDENDTRNYKLFMSRWRDRYDLDLERIEREAIAAGVDLKRDRIETRRERVDRERRVQAELEQLRTEREQVGVELERLRAVSRMRSVRATLWVRRVFRRVVPA